MTVLTIPFTGLRKQYNNLRTEILAATDKVLRSGQLMNGNCTAEFENWLANKNGVKYAVTCHSGTGALEVLAEYHYQRLSTNTAQPTVLIPTFTYAATANAFIRAGWNVILVDTDSYGVLDVTKIPDVEYHVVCLVGLYGLAVTHHGTAKIWEEWLYKNVTVIEDAAQHWLSADCKRVGNAAAISFDPMKNLPCYGNGGAIVTDSNELLHFARAWRDNGKSTHINTGTNSRMSELDCAHMMVKAQYIDQWQERRKKIATHWIDRLKPHSDIWTLIDVHNSHNHAFHKFVIYVSSRDTLQRNLALRKIETKIHYAQPLHEVGVFRNLQGPDILSSASSLARGVLSLPIYPELTDLEVEYIIDQVIDCA